MARFCVQRSAGEESQFVRILAGRGHTDRAGAVKVEVGQLVGQPLELVRPEPALVPDDVVARWIHSALADRL